TDGSCAIASCRSWSSTAGGWCSRDRASTNTGSHRSADGATGTDDTYTDPPIPGRTHFDRHQRLRHQRLLPVDFGDKWFECRTRSERYRYRDTPAYGCAVGSGLGRRFEELPTRRTAPR